MARDIFAWAPLIALVCGVFASLGLFRSTKRAFGLGAGAVPPVRAVEPG